MNAATTKALATVLLLGALLLYATLQQHLHAYDEGFMLEGARRLWRGEFLYTDFWTIYPIGQYQLMAWSFDWLGESVSGPRLVDALTRLALSCVAAFSVARVTQRAAWGVATGLLLLVWQAAVGFPNFPGFTALLLITCAAALWAHAPQSAHPRLQFSVAGTVVGTAALFRHDMAGYAGLAFVGTEVLLGALWQRSRWAPLACGIAGMVGAVAAGITWQLQGAAPMAMLEQLVLQPAKVMPLYRWMPWPEPGNLRTLPVLLVPILTLITLATVALPFMRQAPLPLRRLHMLHALTAAVMLAQLSSRRDVIHATPAWLALIPALCMTWQQAWAVGLRHSRPLAWAVLLFTGVMCLGITARPAAKAVWATAMALKQTPDAPLFSRLGWASLEPDQQALLARLQALPASSVLYVGVEDHDRFTTNEPAWYFLSGWGSRVFLHDLHPGVSNAPELQRQTLQEMARHGVNVVILTHSECDTVNQSCLTPQVNLVDDHIRQHFRLAHRAGKYSLWLK